MMSYCDTIERDLRDDNTLRVEICTTFQVSRDSLLGIFVTFRRKSPICDKDTVTMVSSFPCQSSDDGSSASTVDSLVAPITTPPPRLTLRCSSSTSLVVDNPPLLVIRYEYVRLVDEDWSRWIDDRGYDKTSLPKKSYKQAKIPAIKATSEPLYY